MKCAASILVTLLCGAARASEGPEHNPGLFCWEMGVEDNQRCWCGRGNEVCLGCCRAWGSCHHLLPSQDRLLPAITGHGWVPELLAAGHKEVRLALRIN